MNVEKELKEIKEKITALEKSVKSGANIRPRAENGRNYYYIDSRLLVDYCTEYFRDVDNGRYELGNYYLTELEAEQAVENKRFWAKYDKARTVPPSGDGWVIQLTMSGLNYVNWPGTITVGERKFATDIDAYTFVQGAGKKKFIEYINQGRI